MDWRGVTQRWVQEGLITAEQREPLLRWLDEHAPPNRWLAERVLPVLVTLACWLLTGSAFVVAEVRGVPQPALSIGFAMVGGVQVAAGLLAEQVEQRGLAVGAVAAGLVVFSVSAAGASELLAMAAGAAVVGVSSLLAARLRSRGVALAGTLGGVWVAFGWLDAVVPLPAAAAFVVVALGWLFALTVAVRRMPWVLAVDVSVFFPVFALLRLAWEATVSGGQHALVAATSSAGLGLVLLALAAAGRSVGLLAAAVVCFVFAEGYLLDGVSDPVLAVALLGGEGLAILAGALAFVVWRAGRTRRPVPPPPG
jgi:hypothetical protein